MLELISLLSTKALGDLFKLEVVNQEVWSEINRFDDNLLEKGLSGKRKPVVIMSDKIRFSSDKDETADELHHRGMLFRKTGKPREAISYFDKALKINPYHVDALTNKGH